MKIFDEFSQNIANKLHLQRIHIIFNLSINYAYFSFDAISKKQYEELTDWYHIYDLFSPHENLINDEISEHYRSFIYQILNETIKIIRKLDQYIILHKRDLKDAFHKISINLLNQHLLLFKWKDQIYIELFLSFDLATSSFIFNMFIEILY